MSLDGSYVPALLLSGKCAADGVDTMTALKFYRQCVRSDCSCAEVRRWCGVFDDVLGLNVDWQAWYGMSQCMQNVEEDSVEQGERLAVAAELQVWS